MPGTVDENIHNLNIVSKMLIYKEVHSERKREILCTLHKLAYDFQLLQY